MKITIYSKKIKQTKEIEEYIEQKIGKFEKFLKNIIESWVEIDEDTSQRGGNKFRIEVQMRVPNFSIRACETTADIFTAIDLVVPRLKKQIEEYRTRFIKTKRGIGIKHLQKNEEKI